jgi:Glycosyl hydrolase family 26
VVLGAVALAVAAVVVVVVRLGSAGPTGPAAAHASLPTSPASYLGVYEHQAPSGFGQIAQFAAAAGRQPNLDGYYSGWPEPFKAGFAKMTLRHGAATLVQIDPTGASIAAIAAGDYDRYLRTYADAVRNFGHAIVIGFGHEMNANWYSWGYGHVRPATFVAAWRHLVTVFRQQGADNVTWLWTIQADIRGSGPIQDWWPGKQFVTWVGIDGYYYRPSDMFATVFGRTISQVRLITSKPLLLSEAAVGPQAGQSAKIRDLFRGMASYQTLGLVWFDIAQHDGIYHQDWRIEDNLAAERSFRLGVRAELAPARQG